MAHEVLLPFDCMPIVNIVGRVVEDRPFLHPDRVLPLDVLLYVQQGEIEVIEEHIRYRMPPGGFLFLKSGQHHWGETLAKPNTKLLYVHFILDFDATQYQEFDPFASFVRQQALEPDDYRAYLKLPKTGTLQSTLLESKLQQLLTHYQSSDSFRVANLNAELTLLLTELYQMMQQNQKVEKADIVVRKLISFLENHTTCPLSSDEIASHMRMSYKYLCSIFKQKTGYSINEYHTRLRIHEAARLLRETSFNVSEVSYTVGYRDPLYFSGVFKKVQGKSPSEYLKQASKGIF